jgi:NADP-dependent 3-hydroxy acid dehydrogenase YdfG
MALATTLEGRIAAITGASSGMGAATARRLATRGAKVALIARRADKLNEIVAGIKDAGGTAIALGARLGKSQ